jgi:EAL domain-containing protein (putative c-di-GMP-specific phosphodiesterase class I)
MHSRLQRRIDFSLDEAVAPPIESAASRRPVVHLSAPHLLELEADLRRALGRDELRVHYLPIVDLTTRRAEGVEALLRWAHPVRGLLPPAHFMPFAEESGLIVPMGRWLLRQAGRELRSCRRISPALGLHVNLSLRQLQHAELLETLDAALGEHGLDPRAVTVEVTESALHHHAGRIAELRDRGLHVCVDDFGSGGCTLEALFRCRFDMVKIHRSLLPDDGRSPGWELVRSIVALARELDVRVLAAGVENVAQLEMLREAGICAAQGHLFAEAVDIDGAQALLEAGETG